MRTMFVGSSIGLFYFSTGSWVISQIGKKPTAVTWRISPDFMSTIQILEWALGVKISYRCVSNVRPSALQLNAPKLTFGSSVNGRVSS